MALKALKFIHLHENMYNRQKDCKFMAFNSYKLDTWGDIKCQFLMPGSSIGPSMFCNFYLVKNHKIANNSATTEARKK
jgi:hypothetical protein